LNTLASEHWPIGLFLLANVSHHSPVGLFLVSKRFDTWFDHFATDSLLLGGAIGSKDEKITAFGSKDHAFSTVSPFLGSSIVHFLGGGHREHSRPSVRPFL
jgi:hypothetical protein